MNGFPDFGQGLRRSFEVDERCFDCAELYHGCQAHLENPGTHCRDYLHLPDVKPGTCGQTIPLSRMNGRKEPRIRSAAGAPVRVQVQPKNPPSCRRTPAEPEPIEQPPVESSRQTASKPDTAPPAVEVPREDSPTSRPREPGKPKARICGCGAALPKGKRLCDTCRTEARRRTKRQYMQTYMEQRRSPTSGSDPDVPSTHETTHATHAGGEDRRSTGHPAGVPGFLPTSVLTNM